MSTVMEELIFREIETQKLAKKHVAILSKCDRLVNHYRQYCPEVSAVRLFRDDYKNLAETLEKAGQKIEERTYHGYRLLPE